MKLFWKITLFAMIVLSVALSLSGYLLITSSYKNAIDQETQRAMDQYQYIKFLLQADLIHQQDPIDSNNLSDQFSAGFSNGGNYIAVFGENQTPIYSTFPVDPNFNISNYKVNQKIVNKMSKSETGPTLWCSVRSRRAAKRSIS